MADFPVGRLDLDTAFLDRYLTRIQNGPIDSGGQSVAAEVVKRVGKSKQVQSAAPASRWKSMGRGEMLGG